jgi:integrase
LRVLKSVWIETPETAKRLREKIEAIIDAATAKGLRQGDNPARWKGHLEHLLPKRQRVEKSHHAAMSYRHVPEFWQRLRELETVGSLALQFTILAAARSGEVYGAKWDEIDMVNKVWILPPSRMKAGRQHRVPLSDAALMVLEKCARIRKNDFVFAGQRKDKPLSHVSMANVLSRLGIENATPHGFRSTFRDFAGNETHFAREVCEAALAHSIGDSAEQAYRREDALEKRRQLMSVWASHVCGDGKVIPMRRKV